jgi:hypothetical protein
MPALFAKMSVIPFMVMPDAVKSLLLLTDAPKEALSRLVYNVTSFSLTAADFRDRVLKAFPWPKSLLSQILSGRISLTAGRMTWMTALPAAIGDGNQTIILTAPSKNTWSLISASAINDKPHFE